MNHETLKKFFNRYIQGTPEKAMVADRKMFLCRLTLAVQKGIGLAEPMRGVCINSKCLKHLFDRKPAEEFMFLLDHFHQMAKYPDRIYRNKNSKRGGYCFVKRIGDAEYLCSIEVVSIPPAESGVGVEIEEVQVATAFRIRDDKYIKNYTLLWDWGNGNPHRSVLDTPKGTTHAPQ